MLFGFTIASDSRLLRSATGMTLWRLIGMSGTEATGPRARVELELGEVDELDAALRVGLSHALGEYGRRGRPRWWDRPSMSCWKSACSSTPQVVGWTVWTVAVRGVPVKRLISEASVPGQAR